MGERGDPGQDRRRVGDRRAPDVGIVAVAGFKDDGGTARAAACEVELAATADSDPPCEGAIGRDVGGRGDGSGLGHGHLRSPGHQHEARRERAARAPRPCGAGRHLCPREHQDPHQTCCAKYSYHGCLPSLSLSFIFFVCRYGNTCLWDGRHGRRWRPPAQSAPSRPR